MSQKTKLTVFGLLFGIAVSLQVYASDVIVNEGMNGNSVVVQPDAMLVVELVANPSTGYAWRVVSFDKSVLEDVSGSTCTECGPEYVYPASVPGTPAKQILRFTGKAKGQTGIVLWYERPWENGKVAPSKTYSLAVASQGAYQGTLRRVRISPKPYVAPPKSEIDAYALPAHFNWNDSGWITPVKDQGAAASCWAHGAAAVFEAKIKKKTGVTRDLSEQYLISCNPWGFSAGAGGWWAHPMHWMYVPAGEQEAGAVYESDFPYQAADVDCGAPHTHHEQIENWGYIDHVVDGNSPSLDHNSTTADIKQAIWDHGPIATDICASNWGSYTGGVFTQDCSPTDHIVLITGWDDNAGCFYVKNSWGSSFGENGYIRLAYGICKIGHNATYVEYEKTNPRLIYAGDAFNEKPQNNGQIANAIKVTLTDAGNGTFSMASGEMVQGVHYTVTNVPAGLTPKVQMISSTVASITLTGAAASHAKSNSITNGTITFLDAAFSNILASNVEYAAQKVFSVNFFDPFRVVHETFTTMTCTQSSVWQFTYFGNGAMSVGLWYTGVNTVWPADPEQRTFKLETYTRPAICTGTSMTGKLVPLAKGAPINAASQFWCPGGSYGKQHTITGPTYTVWNGRTAYVGAKYTLNTFPIYVWFQLRVSAAGTSVTLIDCAYNEDPLGYINAGELTGVTSVNENRFSEPAENGLRNVRTYLSGKNLLLSYTLSAKSLVRCEVVAASGKLVKILNDREMTSGYHTATWMLDNSAGAPVSNGVYFIRVSDGASSAVARVAVTR